MNTDPPPSSIFYLCRNAKKGKIALRLLLDASELTCHCADRHCCSTQKAYHNLIRCLKRWIRDLIPLLSLNILKSVKNASLPWVPQSQGLLCPACLEKVFERVSCSDVCNFNDPVKRRIWCGHREACPLHIQLLTIKNSLWALNVMSILQPSPTLALKIIQESIIWPYTCFGWKKHFNTRPQRTLYFMHRIWFVWLPFIL